MPAPKKILIVDDEPDMVEWLTTFFEDHGFVTVAAYDGVDGMEKVLSEHPDLITLDITMEKETGIKMYRRLHESAETAAIPVIMITGISEGLGKFLDRKKGLGAPAAYFEKPVDQEALLKTVREITA